MNSIRFYVQNGEWYSVIKRKPIIIIFAAAFITGAAVAQNESNQVVRQSSQTRIDINADQHCGHYPNDHQDHQNRHNHHNDARHHIDRGDDRHYHDRGDNRQNKNCCHRHDDSMYLQQQDAQITDQSLKKSS